MIIITSASYTSTSHLHHTHDCAANVECVDKEQMEMDLDTNPSDGSEDPLHSLMVFNLYLRPLHKDSPNQLYDETHQIQTDESKVNNCKQRKTQKTHNAQRKNTQYWLCEGLIVYTWTVGNQSIGTEYVYLNNDKEEHLIMVNAQNHRDLDG
eukprot:195617_1